MFAKNTLNSYAIYVLQRKKHSCVIYKFKMSTTTIVVQLQVYCKFYHATTSENHYLRAYKIKIFNKLVIHARNFNSNTKLMCLKMTLFNVV